MRSHWWEVHCSGCGAVIAHSPSTHPLPGLYCTSCMEEDKAREEAEAEAEGESE